MSRSSKKGAYVEPSLLKKVLAMKQSGKKKPIKTWARRSTISPEFVGYDFQVHNGKAFINVTVTDEMIGHKLGEFALTRKFEEHSLNNKAAMAKEANK